MAAALVPARRALPRLPRPRHPARLRVAGLDIPEDHRPEDLTPALAVRVCDALGLLGPAEHCAERLLRARAETGAEHVFLFPAHTEATGYDLPGSEVAAFRDVIGPLAPRRAHRPALSPR